MIDPMCEHEGYNCECEPLKLIDPFSRKPTFKTEQWSESCDYVFYNKEVGQFREFELSIGHTDEEGYPIIPNGYFGHWIFLDQEGLWGYNEWDEWKFEVAMRNEETGERPTDWCPVAGVNYINSDGRYVFEYILRLPDETVEVGDFYTPIYYEGVSPDNIYTEDMSNQLDAPSFEIGAPYLPKDEYDQLVDWYNAIYIVADENHDMCVTREEIMNLFSFGMLDPTMIQGITDQTFAYADINNSGVLSWAEINQFIPSLPDSMFDEADKKAMEAFFKYFDYKYGSEQDFKMSKDEMMAGILDLASQVGYFYAEYNFWWDYFDMDNDGCISNEELHTQLQNYYQVTDWQIFTYWLEYYETTYGVTESLFYFYYIGNGNFNWDGYYAHVEDGPAMRGAQYLVYQDTEQPGAPTVVFMWYKDNICYFSFDFEDNTDPASSGTCNIAGHPSIGNPDSIVTNIFWNSYIDPEHTLRFGRDTTESEAWGPIVEQTDERFYSGEAAGLPVESWLWMKPESYCDLCDPNKQTIPWPEATYTVEEIIVEEEPVIMPERL